MTNKKTLTLSVIIPAYNEESYIGPCLDAIAQQTEPPDEVIVVDNNSQDGTVNIAKQYSFVKLLHQKKQGLRPTRDMGIAAATGDVVGRIDADSRMSPQWCQQVRRIFKEDPQVSAATGPCQYYDMPLEKVGLLFDRSIRKRLYEKDCTPVLFGSNMALRKSAWDEIYPLLCQDGEFFEDYDITLHLRELEKTIVYDDALVMGVSSRRLDDGPRDFAANMSLHTKTVAMHGTKSKVARYGKYIYLSTYPPLRMIRKVYDADQKKLSLKKALKKTSVARPDGANS
jgi:glycosyltransferase involved in cell wall biosynthesis